MKGWLILGSVLLAHLGYKFVGGPADESYVFYVFRGVEGAILCAVLLQYVKTWPAVLGCWLGIIEETQTAVCGAFQPEIQPGESLCSGMIGTAPYIAIFVIAAYMLWKTHNDRQSRGG